ncbi:MAG: hypothetical protein DMG93_17140 [Acidobacteria bacterium]|nr:MAG: hypothetical protein DMG93_17140 [Acidobacteriota bacterium]
MIFSTQQLSPEITTTGKGHGFNPAQFFGWSSASALHLPKPLNCHPERSSMIRSRIMLRIEGPAFLCGSDIPVRRF